MTGSAWRCTPALLLALLLAACGSLDHGAARATAPARVAATPSWHDDVAAISAHTGSAERRATIRGLLAGSGIDATETAFTTKDLHGANLIAHVSGDPSQPLLLIGAHLDQIDKGNGATDNASGSGVALALARRFHERPLRNHRVAVAFWDLEEKGLLGAHAHVEGGGEKPVLYVNFDVFGWGDTLWMMTPDPAHPLATASETAARANGLRLSAGEKYSPSDHRAFLRAGWPAVSYSLVGADEIGPILQMFDGNRPETVPKVMQVIHSERDTVDELDPAAVEAGINAVEAALRAWDAGNG